MGKGDPPQSAHSEGAIFEEKFGAQEYIQTYYPQLTDVAKLVAIARTIRRHYEVSDSIDITSIAEETKTGHETIENLAVFDFQRVIVKRLLEVYPKGEAQILDVGGGPTIYQHIALSLPAAHITHSEFLEKNRTEVLRWLNEEEGAHTWDGYFELMKEILKEDHEFVDLLEHQILSGEKAISSHGQLVKNILAETSVDTFKHHVRTRIGNDVVHGDVFEKDLGLADTSQPTFDVITCNFVIEGATGERARWEEGMRYIMGHIPPGGFFVQTSVKNASWYLVGKEKVPASKVDEHDICRMCETCGFKVIEQRILAGSDVQTVGYDGMVFTLAQRL